MSAFIEVRVMGGRRALLEAGMIGGALTSPHKTLSDLGDDKGPVMVVIRGGEGIPVVGESAIKIMARAKAAQAECRARAHQAEVSVSEYIFCDLLDKPTEPVDGPPG